MKNIKTIVIYAVLGLAIILAFAGYIMGDNNSSDVSDQVTQQAEAEYDAANDSGESDILAEAAEEVEAVESGEETEGESSTTESEVNLEEDMSVYDGIDERLVAIMESSTVLETENPIVGIGQGLDYDAVTREAIANAGGLEDIIEEGDTVLIKPNLIRLAKPGQGIITDYRVVQTIADMAKEAGASMVIVAEASPNGDLFNDYTEYTQLIGVEFVDMNALNEEDCYLLEHKMSQTEQPLHIPKVYMDADVVITAAKLKTHYEAILTLGLKNAFGVPPTTLVGTVSGKYGLHSRGIDESILDLNLIRKPDFTVIDGIVGGEGNMPLNGTPVDSQVVFAGKDIVATDTVAATFMGYTLEQVRHIRIASLVGLGINDMEAIEVVGAELDDIAMEFAPSLSY